MSVESVPFCVKCGNYHAEAEACPPCPICGKSDHYARYCTDCPDVIEKRRLAPKAFMVNYAGSGAHRVFIAASYEAAIAAVKADMVGVGGVVFESVVTSISVISDCVVLPK